MQLCVPIPLVRCAIAYCLVLLGCHPETSPSRRVVNNFVGMVSKADGTPAADASIAVTSLTTAVRAAVTPVDRSGAFHLSLPAGDYAITVTSDSGFAVLDKYSIPDNNARITLSSACHVVKGCADEHGPATQVSVEHRSAAGNVFATMLGANGCFAICVPEGYYDLSLRGDTLSAVMEIRSPSAGVARIDAVTAAAVRSAPPAAPPIRAGLDGLVSDIIAANPMIIGMGEATHGTAEFVSSRAELTLALMKRADVHLLLFEVDAIAAIGLDDYVTGGDVDIAKAVAAAALLGRGHAWRVSAATRRGNGGPGELHHLPAPRQARLPVGARRSCRQAGQCTDAGSEPRFPARRSLLQHRLLSLCGIRPSLGWNCQDRSDFPSDSCGTAVYAGRRDHATRRIPRGRLAAPASTPHKIPQLARYTSSRARGRCRIHRC